MHKVICENHELKRSRPRASGAYGFYGHRDCRDHALQG